MEKITYLKYIDFLYGGIMILLGLLLMLLGVLSSVLTFLAAGMDGIVTIVISLVVYCVMGLIMAAVGAACVWVGRGIESGGGRIIQTILCLMMLPACFPIGLACGAFGLWVMWMNEETKGVFEGAGAA